MDDIVVGMILAFIVRATVVPKIEQKFWGQADSETCFGIGCIILFVGSIVGIKLWSSYSGNGGNHLLAIIGAVIAANSWWVGGNLLNPWHPRYKG